MILRYFQRNLLPSLIILFLANLLPIYGVIFLGWNAFLIIFLFWFENLTIGFYNILRMLFSEPGDIIKWPVKLFMIPFFTFHYGMFTFGHGIFVVGFFGKMINLGTGTPSLELIINIIARFNLGYAVLAVFFSHGFSLIYNYIIRKEYRYSSLKTLMLKPYSRIVIMHLVIIIGGFLVFLLKLDIAGLLLLIALKIIFDLRAHLRDHRLS